MTNKAPEVNQANLAAAVSVRNLDSLQAQTLINEALTEGGIPAVPTATSGNVVAVVNQLRTALLGMGAVSDGD